MFGHLPELFFILVIALIVFGPEKLPEVAANAGRMVRELREAMDQAMNPHDVEVPDDFSSYYYESLEHSGEDIPEAEYDPEFGEIEGYADVAAGAHDLEMPETEVAAGVDDLAGGSDAWKDHWDEPH